MLRMSAICGVLIGCGGTHATVDAPTSTDARDAGDDAAIDAPAGRVLRELDGAATLHADGTAVENGVTFATVKDGTPALPTIALDEMLGNVLAITVPTDTSGHKQRFEWKIAQAADADGLHFDNARYAGFAVKIPATPAPDPFLGSAIFWQAWQGFPYGPPVSLKVVKSNAAPFRVKLAIRNASVGPDSTVPDIELWSADMLDAGTWHTFLVYVQPRFAGGGALKLWVDGTKVLDWTGAIGYDPSQVAGAYNGLDIKDGIYQPDANNGHTFLFDHIVVTTSYATAAHALGWQ
jgi:polysaccharide lyase-like protein